MARYAKDINAIYISERMQENLRHIKESAITSIVAPMGYGKTTHPNGWVVLFIFCRDKTGAW